MKKGTKVIYQNMVYMVWEKSGNAVKIYKPDDKYPELTMILTSANKVKRL